MTRRTLVMDDHNPRQAIATFVDQIFLKRKEPCFNAVALRSTIKIARATSPQTFQKFPRDNSIFFSKKEKKYGRTMTRDKRGWWRPELMLSVTDGMTEMDDPALKAATLGEEKIRDTSVPYPSLSIHNDSRLNWWLIESRRHRTVHQLYETRECVRVMDSILLRETVSDGWNIHPSRKKKYIEGGFCAGHW